MTNSALKVQTTTDLISLLGDFTRTLELEQQTLLALDAEQLMSVAERKTRILERIGQIDSTLMDKITSSEEQDDDYANVEEIRSLIDVCKNRNRENSLMVAQGLKICRNSIGILNSTIQKQSVELYSANGQSNTAISSRNLGEA